MALTDEATFRAALDARGVLRPDAGVPVPARDARYLVFAQRPDARIELPLWNRYAGSFLATRLGLTTDKRYGDDGFPAVDAARVVLAREGGGGTRLIYGRPRATDDLSDAEAAERRGPAGGLAELARRCDTVWLVENEGADDDVALRIATILSGVLLGPIVTPGSARIVGPRTAREELEAR